MIAPTVHVAPEHGPGIVPPLPNQVPRRLVNLTHRPRMHHRSILPVRSEHGPVLQDPRHNARSKFNIGHSFLPTVPSTAPYPYSHSPSASILLPLPWSVTPRRAVPPPFFIHLDRRMCGRAGGDVVTVAEVSACSTFLSPLYSGISLEEGGAQSVLCTASFLSSTFHDVRRRGGRGRRFTNPGTAAPIPSIPFHLLNHRMSF